MTVLGVLDGMPDGYSRPTFTGVGAAFGTFGELLQGALPGPDSDFLVTLPIARWSVATFRTAADGREPRVSPAGKRKSLRLARMVLDTIGAPPGGVLSIQSTLPEGKGLASSSADLVATARAVANTYDTELPVGVLESLLARIEPTDGVLYPGVVAFHHRAVRLLARLGSLPPLTVVAVDEGGEVDTIDYNRVPKSYSARRRAEYAVLLDRLSVALAVRDLPEVGAVATRSAVLNQVFNPKRYLEPIIRICLAHTGLGVVTAHSGTTLGVLLDNADPGYSDKLAAVAAACCAVAGDVVVHHSLSFDTAIPFAAGAV